MARLRKLVFDTIDMQSVDFQPTEFFTELTTLFGQFNGGKNTEDAVDKIQLITKHHTGIDVKLIVGMEGPSMDSPEINKNSVLFNDNERFFCRNYDVNKEIRETGSMVKGYVNLKTGQVSGFWSTILINIYMPTFMVNGTKYLPEECAAFYLHELGHAFTFFEYVSRSVTTNQVLASMSRGLAETKSMSEREAILMSVKTRLHLKDLDVAELASTGSDQLTEVVVITEVAKQSRSELGINIYDLTSCESLADEYSARYGAGRYLISGLEKMERGVMNISYRSLGAYLGMEALKLILISLAPLSATISLYPAVVMLMMDSNVGNVHGLPGARFNRIRAQLVQKLKAPKLSKEDSVRVTEDIKVIDDILKTIHDRRQLFDVVNDFIISTFRKERNIKLLQQDLEKVASNALFVKAAELRQMA